MAAVLQLAMRNVEQETGGPFAAAVFDLRTGELVSIGVNRVVPLENSLAHAEVMALGLAHVELGTYDLSSRGARLQLVSSSQMCTMCLGAVIWSGVAAVAYSTTSTDVAACVGFDEGPTPPDYAHQLACRGIEVIPGLMRDEGLEVLRRYVAQGGVVYKARR